MTEKEFLISRALNVFNSQYGRNILVEHCEIFSIPTNVQSDRAYEITTPNFSEFFRIRLYVKFDRMDKDIPAPLEVTMPYIDGKLGDEVYVVLCYVADYWRNQGYKFDPIVVTELPWGVIIQEDEKPITTEAGRFMVVEDSYVFPTA